MNRRHFIGLLGAAATCPFAARAQQSVRMPRVGILIGTAEDDPAAKVWIARFISGLEELGRYPGRNVELDFRWGNGIEARIREQSAELANRPPDVILAVGTAATGAIKKATTSVPVVFAVVNDPVAQGFVSSMAKPGGNITGFSLIDYTVIGKAMGLLKQVAPATTRFVLMFNPDTYPYYETYLKSIEGSPSTPFALTGLRLRSAADIDPAIAALPEGVGLVVAPDTFTNVNRGSIIAAAARYRVPATYPYRLYANDGGLMAYGPNPADLLQRSAAYVDRILKGVRPADLPIQAPSKFEFVINAKTAKALGLAVPTNLLFTADEVIE